VLGREFLRRRPLPKERRNGDASADFVDEIAPNDVSIHSKIAMASF
jgi:hypothetical protein